ncbi:hypothetical protein ACEYYA_04270 [Paracoccus sp. p3-h83]|uniref:hypothetical protein n=1 Tax=Paracoccus sp. p3-h83 TaxID=3342805 RepID=UPI0035BA62E8
MPLPGGAAADLARACALSRPDPGRALPAPVADALSGLPALIRPGAAILLADSTRAEEALYAMAEWLHHCRAEGRDAACLSLIQPIAAPFAHPPADWHLKPLFYGRTL